MTGQEAPAGVNLEALRLFLAENVEGAEDAPIWATLIEGGRSNLTYVITQGDREWVLRRPPLGHVLPTAHDMVREYRVIAALRDTDVPVPRAMALCEDPSVNGAPFYIMEKVNGRVVRTAQDAEVFDPATALRASEELIDVLARIHDVDYEAMGLGDHGHPEGYLDRQVTRWSQQWERSKTREMPAVDELITWLHKTLPTSGAPTIVHGDYRMDNVMFAPDDLTRAVAVLDWEMSTLGDPLADVGLLLVYWNEASDTQGNVLAMITQSVTARPGFLTRTEVAEFYAKRSGRDVDALDYYVVLGFYKLAVVLEGIHARYLQGKTLGEGFEMIGLAVPFLVEAAMDIVAGRRRL